MFAEFRGYELQSVLGSGATGTVYLARQLSTGRDVAVKALAPALVELPGFLQRFRTEARTMARFDSENLVSVYDYFERDGAAYLVMQYVAGVSLRELIDRSGPLQPEQAVGVLAGVLSGLAEAHRLGIVHGDVKPENILVSPEGVSKLIDFGQSGPTGSHSLGGSPAYASPEAVRDEPLSPRSDLYAAGLLCYELLTGTLPFTGTPAEVLVAQRDLQPPRHRAIPRRFADVIDRALAKSPDDRQENAEVLLFELDEAASTSYGADWRAQASIAAVAGAVIGGSTAAVRAGLPGASGAPARASLAGRGRAVRRLRRGARLTRNAAVHHPVAAGIAAVAVASTVAVVALVGNSAPLAGSWQLVSASLVTGSISCANADHCVALAGPDAVVVSPGNSVQVVSLPPSSGTMTSVDCSSDRYCWAVGSLSPASGSAPGRIMTSVDAGHTWNGESLPPGIAALSDLSCVPDTTDCWAVGGTSVISTTDGRVWHVTAAPTNVGTYDLISCPSASVCVATTTSAGVLSTSNGGRTWLANKQSFPLLYGTSSIDCPSTTRCWMTGNYSGGLPPTNFPAIYRSLDGGATWQSEALPKGIPIYGTDHISCSSPEDCLVSATTNDGGLLGSSGAPVFASTTSGGSHWRVVRSPSTVVSAPELDCTTRTVCWLSGGNGIGTTSDAGRSWTPLLLPATMTPGGLSCANASSCLLSGSAPFDSFVRTGIGGNNPHGPFVLTGTTAGGALGTTTDGARSWRFTLTDHSLTDLGAISCPVGAACEVAGELSSTSTELFRLAGTRLIRTSAPAGLERVTGLSCDAATCWLVGVVAGQSVVERSDGSGRWSLQPLPAHASLLGAISCPASSLCVLTATVSSKPALLVTYAKPGFATVPLPSSVVSLGGLDCVTATTCWLGATTAAPVLKPAAASAAPSAVILRTTSLGSSSPSTDVSWTSEALPPGLGAPAMISCPSLSTCVAVAPDTPLAWVVLGAGTLPASFASSPRVTATSAT
ncbi:MAG: protein kinase domain-containing protein [Acidimicrobiales bacterium]